MVDQVAPQVKHMLDLLSSADGLFVKPKIDYDVFRDKWLPLFNAASHDGLAPLGEWIQAVARGNPFMPVDVIRGGHTTTDELYPDFTTVVGGTFMFSVPPILNNQIQIKMKDGQDMDSAALKAGEIGKRVAVAGQRSFEKNVVNNIQVEVPVDPGLGRAMDSIFEHFGLSRSNAIAKTTEAPKSIETPKASAVDNNDIDFDF